MNQKLILYPLFAQFLLAFIVLCRMGQLRFKSIMKNRARIQSLADPVTEARVFQPAINPSDNFENLFELPVIFYAVTILIYTLRLADPLHLFLCTVFVAFRYAHSYVHCTSNHVRTRFKMYLVSTAALLALVVRLGIQVALA